MEENIIVVTNLTKQFKEFKAVDDISFNVKHGEIFAFLGPNGAGKTTTIKMLTTLLHPSKGIIRLNNFDPMRQQHEVRKSFGIVFQDASLDDELTAYENMDFHAVFYKVKNPLKKERVEYLLKLVDLWDRRKSLVKTFSGGMKRRLEIARGLIHEPRILFLDEPTIGLDPQTRNRMWEYLKNLNKEKGMTVFFTTHYMEEADKVADRIAVIDHGKIIAQGTSKELKVSTETNSLEDAFLKMTGRVIREESSASIDSMRITKRVWGRLWEQSTLCGFAN